MKYLKGYYLSEISVFFGIGLVHSFGYSLDLAEDVSYNTAFMSAGFLYWMANIFFVFYKTESRKWNFNHSAMGWAKISGLCLTVFCYWLCPVVFAMDFSIVKSEGPLCFTFLNLGLIPFKHLIAKVSYDQVSEFEHELENAIEDQFSEDEDYPLAS